MIKINLANSILKKSDGSKSTTGSLTEGTMLRDSAIKVALIIAPVIGIMYYEKVDLEAKTTTLARLTEERDTLNKDLTSKQSVDEIVKNVKEQQSEMDDKLHVMEKIFGLRAKKIHTLSLLQKHIPQSLWLEKVSVGEDSATDPNAPGKTVVSIAGYGTSVDDIQVYTTLLGQEKGIFERVRAPNISAEDTTKPDVKKFSFDILLQD